jgi:hypothetical protein
MARPMIPNLLGPLRIALCGWKTDAMFRRYAIVDERDLRSAVEMLAKGTIGGQSPKKAIRAVR